MKASAAGRPPASVKRDDRAETARRTAAGPARAADGRPGRDSGPPPPAAVCACKNSAAASAFWQARSIRRWAVARPRSASQQSNGLLDQAPGRDDLRHARPDLLAARQSRPRITSLWPLIVLVRLSITRSAPSSSGRQRIGEANVLSISSDALRRWAISASAAMSATSSSGLAIVSARTSFVFGSNRRRGRRQVARIDRRHLDPQPRASPPNSCQRLAIHAAADDGVVARLQLREQRRGQRPHAGGGDRGPLGGVQLPALLGQQVGVGMAVALIDIARLAAGEHVVGLLRALAGPDAGADRSAGRAASWPAAAAAAGGGRGRRAGHCGFRIADCGFEWQQVQYIWCVGSAAVGVCWRRSGECDRPAAIRGGNRRRALGCGGESATPAARPRRLCPPAIRRSWRLPRAARWSRPAARG